MKPTVSLIGHALVGWGVCGLTMMIGRRFLPMGLTLVVHAVVATLTFALLASRYAGRHPDVPAARIAWTMLGVVVGLDALVVAPFMERSYEMFQSVAGTWVPFALILAASHFSARRAARGHAREAASAHVGR